METPEGKSLTVMTDKQDGPSWWWRFVIDVRHETLRKIMVILRREVFDRHDGCAGWTVESMMVDRRFRKRTLRECWRPLGKMSLTTITIVQDRPLRVCRSVIDVRKRTIRKSWGLLGKGSLTTRLVVQDGPSWKWQFVACVGWWTLWENWTDPMMVHRGYDGPSLGYHSVIQWQNSGCHNHPL